MAFFHFVISILLIFFFLHLSLREVWYNTNIHFIIIAGRQLDNTEGFLW